MPLYHEGETQISSHLICVVKVKLLVQNLCVCVSVKYWLYTKGEAQRGKERSERYLLARHSGGNCYNVLAKVFGARSTLS
eukprot:839814-Rhodomonas_salina.1